MGSSLGLGSASPNAMRISQRSNGKTASYTNAWRRIHNHMDPFCEQFTSLGLWHMRNVHLVAWSWRSHGLCKRHRRPLDAAADPWAVWKRTARLERASSGATAAGGRAMERGGWCKSKDTETDASVRPGLGRGGVRSGRAASMRRACAAGA